MIWGIDLGVRSIYLSGIKENGSLHTVDLVVAQKMSSRSVELTVLGNSITGIISEEDSAFVEEPPLAGSRNIRTALQLSQLMGAVMACAPGHTYEVPVSSWKKATVGRGNASKEEVAKWLSQEHPQYYQRCSGDQNLVDATCIALYGQGRLDLVQR